MKEDTKACNLTEREIKSLLTVISNNLWDDDKRDECMERLNYLNKRLKAFTDAPSVGSSEATGTEQPAPATPAWPGS